jgi:ligand-binding SRPBCC domain-containing protein
MRSRLAAPADRVWERVSTFAGINDELWPLLRMTAPAHVTGIDPARVRPGGRVFRSRLLLFGVLPVEHDDLTLVSIEAGRGFHERSQMLSMRVWEHERRIEPDGDLACVVHDRVAFEPRIAVLGGALTPVVRGLFAHRHRRLHRRFGAPPRPV